MKVNRGFCASLNVGDIVCIMGRPNISRTFRSSIRMTFLGGDVFLMDSGAVKRFDAYWMSILDTRHEEGCACVL